MPTVEIRFSPLPAHVRTARLMAVAVARRSHVAESLLDEIRLAVGEACSRAVRLHEQYAPEVPVLLALADDNGSFAVDVLDQGPYDTPLTEDSTAIAGEVAAPQVHPDELADGFPSAVVLAVIAGLVDDVAITAASPAGTRVHMRWPAGRSAADTQPLDENDLEYDLPV
jgi:anti-sigma regulatory factor (Ser/Thr protein kinase)